jgi:hypothetical protein
VEEGTERLALVSAELVGRADDVANDGAKHVPIFRYDNFNALPSNIISSMNLLIIGIKIYYHAGSND